MLLLLQAAPPECTMDQTSSDQSKKGEQLPLHQWEAHALQQENQPVGVTYITPHKQESSSCQDCCQPMSTQGQAQAHQKPDQATSSQGIDNHLQGLTNQFLSWEISDGAVEELAGVAAVTSIQAMGIGFVGFFCTLFKITCGTGSKLIEFVAMVRPRTLFLSTSRQWGNNISYMPSWPYIPMLKQGCPFRQIKLKVQSPNKLKRKSVAVRDPECE